MVDPTHHHRRIRYKAHLIHWGLLPLALLVPGAYLYVAVDVCQEAADPSTMGLCRATRAVPLLPALLGLAVAGWIVWDLVRLGVERHHAAVGGKRPAPELRHALHGYKALEERHRMHVHLALGQALLVTLALALWLAYEVYRTTF